MNRKKFLKNSIISAAGLAAAKGLATNSEKAEASTYDELMDQVGFNHLPNNETKTMKSVLHKANTRGHANHGWLDTHHTFSFANYRNPERMSFGVLRVLNDDVVAGGRGFRTHPHDNMEIISIPLEGALQHEDSMGNVAVIEQGDVQVMSAGTGIYHSEKNKSTEAEVKFLQIWMFPNKKNVTPRYDQITLEQAKLRNKFFQILSPLEKDDGVWAHQNAWFHIGNLDEGHTTTYKIKASANGVYAFILDGSVTIENQALETRDGYGLWDTEEIKITADSNARVLLMDVPMQLG